MARAPKSQRNNQRHRTRKDLLAAAARLLKSGATPDMDQIAAEALVSRATAYRYFPTIEHLLIEAPLDGVVPDASIVFAGDTSTDPAERIEKAEAVLHQMIYRNQTQLRLMLASSLEQTQSGTTSKIPLRQNRRTDLIEAALAPARHRFTDAAYRKLCASLALVFGTESMIVFSDVLGLDEKIARKTKSWAAKALVNQALAESR